ncbi:MAG: oligosaccharide flippase family protein [Candidatus Babeliaceae bacterium]
MKQVIKHFFVYSGGWLFFKSTHFLLMPWQLKFLSPADLGLVSLCSSFVAIAALLLSCGLRTVFSLEFFHKDEKGRKMLINDLLSIYLCIAVPFLFFFISRTAWVNSTFFQGQLEMVSLILIGIQSFFSFFVDLFYQILVFNKKPLLVAGIQCTSALLIIIFSYKALHQGSGVKGLLVVQTGGLMLMTLIGLGAYIQQKMFCFHDIRRIFISGKAYFLVGLSLLPSIFAGWANASCNRWMLSYFCHLNDVGIYSLLDNVRSFGEIILIYPLTRSYVPFIFEQFIQKKERIPSLDERNKKVMWLLMGIIGMAMVAGNFCIKFFLYRLLPLQYHVVIPYMLFMALSNVFLMGSYFLLCVIQFHKKTGYMISATMLCAGTSGLLSYLLIPRFFLAGATGAYLIGSVVYFGILWLFNRRVHSSLQKTL